MRTEFAQRWERDLRITVCLAYVTVSFSSDLTSNPTFPNLESTFERGRDITAYRSTISEAQARVYALVERQSVAYATLHPVRERSRKPKFIPATKSATEGLRKVTLDSSDEAAASFTCAICRQEGLLDDPLEALEEEKEIENHGNASLTTTQLPCSHIYHETCIVRWLQISHLCPLCRHPMPTAQVGEKSNPA
ncbi:ERAD-associated E3 ubiquitin-protein ligase hrd1-like [Argentina anserina]|uniref:ERAD-associated E3 ubiquitin-protein ligase hrd1-like n=1 Tax=Argentina anserina TaxID=57926 RepID=UPI0021767B3B|nr:ERAD-associated E3 ubiquitin-protein ligase hrd1-like [Potentilla anserina]